MKCLSESAGDVPYADGASKRGGSVASEAGDDNIAEGPSLTQVSLSVRTVRRVEACSS